VAVLAILGGILLWGGIIVLAVGGGDGGANGSSADAPERVPTTVITASIRPTSTPQPTALPDRTSCAEIAGTEYRSLTERDWYRANCLTPTP
jgi:hypothetical protein